MGDRIRNVFVGTAGWKKKQWRGGFYPPGLVQRRELEFTSRQLNSLEINATFHGLQRPSTFANWYAETPDEFVFAVKGLEAVTRAPGFRNSRANLSSFFASGVLELREKLGPLLWQLPSGARFEPESLDRFLALLPRTVEDAANLATESEPEFAHASDRRDHQLRHAIEVRDSSFLNTAFIDILRSHEVAVVFTNAPGSPGFHELTSDFIYIRLSSGEDHYETGYDDATLADWAYRIRQWTAGPDRRDVFAYFKNPAGELPHTPHNAVHLSRMLALEVGASSQRTLDADGLALP